MQAQDLLDKVKRQRKKAEQNIHEIMMVKEQKEKEKMLKMVET